ncbi:hypothetical protein ANABIO32_00390 [Rossellomorea marisflavi]|nr:hypothetical protein [Rossellomorea marisflavi]GLI82353.1 hypothetical protein ANABIO32_00390 [Rossellomorea marisflavi]
MKKVENEIKNLIKKYIDGGNIKHLDTAEGLYNENESGLNTSWEDLVEGV